MTDPTADLRTERARRSAGLLTTAPRLSSAERRRWAAERAATLVAAAGRPAPRWGSARAKKGPELVRTSGGGHVATGEDGKGQLL